MNCNYFGYRAPYTIVTPDSSKGGLSRRSNSGTPGIPLCKAGCLDYNPDESEVNKYCTTDGFSYCPRFIASLTINESKNGKTK